MTDRLTTMKIWLDLTNAPHVNFFESMIAELQAGGHEIFITTRDHSNTIALLKMTGLPYTVVGRHYGKKKRQKIYGFLHRNYALWRLLRKQRVDVGIAHSSFYLPCVARLLRVPSIYLNDNEYAIGNILAFLFATRIMVPETLSLEKMRRQGATAAKTIQYPGVKEAIYLQNFAGIERRIPAPGATELPKIYIRPEPWNAQYYKGAEAFLDPLIEQLSASFHIVVLPRSGDQMQHYLQMRSDRISVIEGALSLADIYRDCALLIGAGGTMTREMAILGAPTISVYQDALLDVDRYLIDRGYLTHDPQPTLETIFETMKRHTQGNEVSLLQQGARARTLILETLQALGGSRIP